MNADFPPRFFVVWDRTAQKFLSITFESTGMVRNQVVGGTDQMVVAEKTTAGDADDLMKRLNRELAR